MVKGISKQLSNDIIVKDKKTTICHTGTVTVHLTKDRHHGNEENAEGSIHKAN
jgi:hypothetical protein